MSRQPDIIVNARGAALIIMLVILVVGIAAVLVNSLTLSAGKTARQEKTAAALAQAKDALIGDSISPPSVIAAGNLRLPDIGFGPPGNTPAEGNAAPSFTGNLMDYSVIGKVPWKNLGISPSRDGQGECLWYVVSGRFKKTPQTDILNWDTQGQIDVSNENGSIIASNIAALLVASGQPVDGQDRALSNPVYTQCGGNYDARNYLDSYNGSDAVSGEVNYFTDNSMNIINHRVALNANNKKFVLAKNDHYNDRFLFITTDDIFRPLIRRSDFSAQISALMNDIYFQGINITGTKGTGSVICNNLGTAANKTFCANWLEMLLLTRLAPPSPITVDGVPSDSCTRVLIFGGQKAAAQVRLTAANKTNPSNYIEGVNLSSFATPVAVASGFVGVSVFSANNPGADLLKCIP